VRSDNIVNGQVKSVDLAKDGTLKSAGLATINPPSGCGFQGAPADQWIQFGPATYGSVAYFRDLLGFVHLQGWAFKCGSPPSGTTIFTLPKGYRPERLQLLGAATPPYAATVGVLPTGEVTANDPGSGALVLDGLSVRCAPSGQDGCP
jgi:hypothetical protein